MNFTHIFMTIASLFAIILPESKGQSSPGTPDTLLAGPMEGKDSLANMPGADKPKASNKLMHTLSITGGQLTIPFKIRRKEENQTFRLTTDVTLGAYIGVTKKLSKAKDYHLTVPMTAGITFVNINGQNTTLDFVAAEADDSEVVPGLTWSTGVILQLEAYNVGVIFGKDYAGEVGDQWLYHSHWWWSFGVGYSFTK